MTFNIAIENAKEKGKFLGYNKALEDVEEEVRKKQSKLKTFPILIFDILKKLKKEKNK